MQRVSGRWKRTPQKGAHLEDGGSLPAITTAGDRPYFGVSMCLRATIPRWLLTCIKPGCTYASCALYVRNASRGISPEA